MFVNAHTCMDAHTNADVISHTSYVYLCNVASSFTATQHIIHLHARKEKSIRMHVHIEWQRSGQASNSLSRFGLKPRFHPSRLNTHFVVPLAWLLHPRLIAPSFHGRKNLGNMMLKITLVGLTNGGMMPALTLMGSAKNFWGDRRTLSKLLRGSWIC